MQSGRPGRIDYSRVYSVAGGGRAGTELNVQSLSLSLALLRCLLLLPVLLLLLLRTPDIGLQSLALPSTSYRWRSYTQLITSRQRSLSVVVLRRTVGLQWVAPWASQNSAPVHLIAALGLHTAQFSAVVRQFSSCWTFSSTKFAVRRRYDVIHTRLLRKMSEIFGKIFGKDKHQSQQSKEKEKCQSPSADKSAASLTASTAAKTSDFCTYTAVSWNMWVFSSRSYCV